MLFHTATPKPSTTWTAWSLSRFVNLQILRLIVRTETSTMQAPDHHHAAQSSASRRLVKFEPIPNSPVKITTSRHPPPPSPCAAQYTISPPSPEEIMHQQGGDFWYIGDDAHASRKGTFALWCLILSMCMMTSGFVLVTMSFVKSIFWPMAYAAEGGSV